MNLCVFLVWLCVGLHLHYGDLTDSSSLVKLISQVSQLHMVLSWCAFRSSYLAILGSSLLHVVLRHSLVIVCCSSLCNETTCTVSLFAYM